MIRRVLAALAAVVALAGQAAAQTVIVPMPYINGAGQANGPILCVDGTSAAPSCGAFISDTTKGMYSSGSNELSWAISGGRKMSLSPFGLQIADSTYALYWNATNGPFLYGSVANTLELRNSTNAQTFRVYGTTTGSKYISLAHDGTNGSIATTAGFMALSPNSGLVFSPGNLNVTSNASILFGIDNTYDIGAIAATRPRNIILGTTLTAGADVIASGNLYPNTNARSRIQSSADGIINLVNNAQTGFTRLILGTNDSSGVALGKNGSALEAQRGDGAAYVTFGALSYRLSGTLVISGTAPTIASGFGTSPSVVANNGTAAFTVNVGTGGTANNGVIGLPTATTGWVCHTQNLTAQAAHRAAVDTRQTASSTTSATIENQAIATGTATAWVASDVLSVSCTAY